MGFEVSHNSKTGEFRLKFSKHVLNVLGIGLVLSGVSSLSSPWWMAIVIAGLEKANLQIHDDYQWIISSIQIILGLLLLAFKYFALDKWEKQKEQDSSTLRNISLNLDKINHYLSDLVDDHSYLSSGDTEFYNSYSTFLKPENSFQFNSTRMAYKEYSENAGALHRFVGNKFWMFPNSQTYTNDYRYCLAPHLNEDRDGDPSLENSKEYTLLSKELHDLQKKTQVSFDNFVLHLKKIGHL